jgi:hypothetical protein
MWIINFGHPLTEAQRRKIEELSGQEIQRVIDVCCRFDHSDSFLEQTAQLVDRIPIDQEEWQTKPILVCPPGFAPIACCVIAELHGRMGHFPTMVRLRPVEGAATQFEVAELINLQALRDRARDKRVGPPPK